MNINRKLQAIKIPNTSTILVKLFNDEMKIKDKPSPQAGDVIRAHVIDFNAISAENCYVLITPEKCYILKRENEILIRNIKGIGDDYHLYCSNPEFSSGNLTIPKKYFNNYFSEIFLCTSYEREV